MTAMPAPFVTPSPLFAQVAQPAQGAKPADNGNFWVQVLPWLWLPLLLYFILLRPQQQQERKRKDLIAALKKNDRVLTAAGIYGTVVSVDADADKVVLRVDDDRGVKLAFSRSSIVRVLEPSEKAAEAV